jgi:hypothetical protein
MLFALPHFCVFHPIATTHPTCVFPSLANDMHIVGLALAVVPIFLQLQEDIGTSRLPVQLTKCVAWSPQGLN